MQLFSAYQYSCWKQLRFQLDGLRVPPFFELSLRWLGSRTMLEETTELSNVRRHRQEYLILVLRPLFVFAVRRGSDFGGEQGDAPILA
jgi:hypothetical protein